MFYTKRQFIDQYCLWIRSYVVTGNLFTRHLKQLMYTKQAQKTEYMYTKHFTLGKLERSGLCLDLVIYERRRV